MAKQRPKPRKTAKKGRPAPGSPSSGGKQPGAGRPKGTVVYTDEEIIEALRRTDGIISDAAAALGCNPQTIYSRFKEHPEMKDLRRAFRERLLDTAKARLRGRVEKDDWNAVRFVLETQGKAEGYVVRTESRIGGDADAPPMKVEGVAPRSRFRDLPPELRRQILTHLRKGAGDSGAEKASADPTETSDGAVGKAREDGHPDPDGQ